MVKRVVNYKHILDNHLHILKNLQYESGLFAASNKNSTTGYNKSWLRDNFYEALAFEVIGDYSTIRKTYKALLKVFLKHEDKIDHAIAIKPKHRYQYIHARFHPETFDEFWDEWGNKQNDAIGAMLFGIGKLHKDKIKIVESVNEKRIVQKLVWYLSTLEYWHDKDSGMWEEDEEVHSSSIGACVAGLKMIKCVRGITVPQRLIVKGKDALANQLPRESKKKFVDLALLSLIWPYNITDDKQTKDILKNVEYHLLKKRGVIRYKNDHYYNKNPDKYSEEAEWTFGLSWLAIIYSNLCSSEKNKNKKQEYEKKAEKFETLALKTVTREKTLPELYFSNSIKYNKNNPLGWSESMFIVALHEINMKHAKVKKK
ncbi:glycoside hydrolase family 15 [Candidatus Woesearchaeota archaeon]|jgi:GH15 family glucan-1,4-alpha-glucosidase|nr:glycoside hydrolase family 15 [Candidatus Woesearchaeota archaeon]